VLWRFFYRGGCVRHVLCAWLGRAGDVPRLAAGRGCAMATIQPSALPWT
jgi:hypothetical protein